MIASRMSVPITETMIEPTQPSRFEKNANIADDIGFVAKGAGITQPVAR